MAAYWSNSNPGFSSENISDMLDSLRSKTSSIQRSKPVSRENSGRITAGEAETMALLGRVRSKHHQIQRQKPNSVSRTARNEKAKSTDEIKNELLQSVRQKFHQVQRPEEISDIVSEMRQRLNSAKNGSPQSFTYSTRSSFDRNPPNFRSNFDRTRSTNRSARTYNSRTYSNSSRQTAAGNYDDMFSFFRDAQYRSSLSTIQRPKPQNFISVKPRSSIEEESDIDSDLEPEEKIEKIQERIDRKTAELEKLSKCIGCKNKIDDERDLLDPCGHTLCPNCANLLKKCPYCDSPIQKSYKIFLH